MHLKALILPGLASPIHAPQSNVYEIICTEAAKRNIDTELIVYPGQFDNYSIHSGNGKGMVLNIENALNLVIRRMSELEDECNNYSIIARSYGCLIALNAVKRLNPCRLANIVLWGITPFDIMYEHFQSNDFVDKCKSKGTIIGAFQENCLPVEHLIRTYNHHATLRLCSGTRDEISTPSYLKYLNSLNLCTFETATVTDANHEGLSPSHPNFDNYINTLLNL